MKRRSALESWLSDLISVSTETSDFTKVNPRTALATPSFDRVAHGGRSKKNRFTEWEWNEYGDKAAGNLGFLDFFIAAAVLLIVLWESANGPVR